MHKWDNGNENFQAISQAGAREPETLANQLLLLMDGAFSATRVFGHKARGIHALQAAKTLIEEQLKK
jgi:hypothetical protein